MTEGTRALTGHERTFDRNEIIVSKTDPQGRITYANDVFLTVSGYAEAELIGKPHSVIRHPEMPRCVFRLLWEKISSGEECFAYVNNRAKNGDNYWVLAHVTPNFGRDGSIIGYHSSRRVPRRNALAAIAPVYESLIGIETREGDRRRGLELSFKALTDYISERGIGYDEFILSI